VTTPDVLAPLVLGLPLIGAALALVAHTRIMIQRLISVGTVTALLGVSVALLMHVEAHGPAAVEVGAWPAPLGIMLVADMLSMLLITIAMVTVLAVLVFAIGHIDRAVERRFFHPLYLVLAAGVGASFITGDLFNLFVAFEVMLIASYVLLTIAGGRDTIRPAMTYVVVNLLASTLFISSVGLLYAATGTVNIADLAVKVAELDPQLQLAFSLLFLVVFGIKAGIFPLFFWLPDSYPTAPSAITAVFAGLLTKVGVYAIIRSQTIVFAAQETPRTLLLTVAGLTMIIGVLGAIAQEEMKRILSFHIISQIGYMIFGIGIATVAGLAGGILYMIHHIPVKTALFLVAGMIQKATGTNELRDLGGLVRRMPLAAVLFMIPALSLAGLPPFSGFFAKLSLAQAGFTAEYWVITGVALGGGILTLFSMTKVWAGVFWGEAPEIRPAEVDAAAAPSDGAVAVAMRPRTDVAARLRVPAMVNAGTIGLVAVTLAIAVAAEPLYDLSVRAAEGLLDPTAYIEAVLSADVATVSGEVHP
jgi:multicomponent Na+:H+ antiporter subunit D